MKGSRAWPGVKQPGCELSVWLGQCIVSRAWFLDKEVVDASWALSTTPASQRSASLSVSYLRAIVCAFSPRVGRIAAPFPSKCQHLIPGASGCCRTWRRVLSGVIESRILKQGDDPELSKWNNVTAKVLARWKRKAEDSEERRDRIGVICCEKDLTCCCRLWRRRKGPRAKKYSGPWKETGKGEGMDPPLELPERNAACDTLLLAWWDQSDFWPPEGNKFLRINLCCLSH